MTLPDRRLREATFDYYWGVLDRNYPYFKQLGIDWQEVKTRYRPRVVGSTDVLEYYRNLSQMLSELKDPHCELISGRFSGDAADLSAGLDLACIGEVRVEGKHYVWLIGDVDGCVPSLRQDFPRRVSVDEYDLNVSTDAANVFRPDRGYTVALERENGKRECFAVPPEQSERTETSARLLWVEWLRYNFMAQTPLELWGSQGMVKVGVTATGGFAATADSSEPFYVPEKVEAKLWRKSRRVPPNENLPSTRYWWRHAKKLKGVGYLRLSTFEPESGGRSDVRDIGGAVRSMLREVGDCDKLIIDMRYNRGGNSGALTDALGYFAYERFSREYIGWCFGDFINPPLYFDVDPVSKPYRGQIAVLVNGSTASAGEGFTMFLREHCGAVVVGEVTRGAEAGIGTVDGPDGSRLSFGRIRWAHEGERSYQTCGLVPDISVPLTIARVREIGYAEAVYEAEIAQFVAACQALGVDGYRALGISPR
jgi:hypothetical protein